MLTLHHLGVSQSERIVWLLEELDLPYTLRLYKRDPFLPPAFKALPGNPLGTAPILHDASNDATMAESAAIAEYIAHKYGSRRFTVPAQEPNYADYLYWFHFSNGTLQSLLLRSLNLKSAQVPPEHPVRKGAADRLQQALILMDERLRDVEYLAGSEVTLADIMCVFCLTTMRYFYPFSLHGHNHILRWLKTVTQREAYQRAKEKGDRGWSHWRGLILRHRRLSR